MGTFVLCPIGLEIEASVKLYAVFLLRLDTSQN